MEPVKKESVGGTGDAAAVAAGGDAAGLAGVWALSGTTIATNRNSPICG